AQTADKLFLQNKIMIRLLQNNPNMKKLSYTRKQSKKLEMLSLSTPSPRPPECELQHPEHQAPTHLDSR
ncbi:hypothetical protein HispidOSU_005422, partial [Sigmodon hispidus]